MLFPDLETCRKETKQVWASLDNGVSLSPPRFPSRNPTYVIFDLVYHLFDHPGTLRHLYSDPVLRFAIRNNVARLSVPR